MNSIYCAVRQFASPILNSNMYIVCHNAAALLVDAIPGMDGIAYLKERGVEHVTLLLTHEHYDHTFGYMALRDQFMVEVICQKNCADAVGKVRNNRPIIFRPLPYRIRL